MVTLFQSYPKDCDVGIVVSESPAFMEMMLISLGARSASPEEALRNSNTEPKTTIATSANAKGQIPNTESSPDSKRDDEAGLVLIASPRLSSLVPFLILERPNVLSLRLCLLIFSRRDIPHVAIRCRAVTLLVMRIWA